MRVQLLIEGADAVSAAHGLAAMPGVEATVTVPDAGQPHKDMAAISAIATIVGLVSGGVGLADTLLRWRRLWRERGTRQLDRVVLVVDGQRASLDGLAEAELRALLERDDATRS